MEESDSESFSLPTDTAFATSGTFVNADQLPDLIVKGSRVQCVGYFQPFPEASRQKMRDQNAHNMLQYIRYRDLLEYRDTCRGVFNDTYDFMYLINQLFQYSARNNLFRSSVLVTYIAWFTYILLNFDDIYTEGCESAVSNTFYIYLIPQILFGLANTILTCSDQLNQPHTRDYISAPDHQNGESGLQYDDNGVPYVRLLGRYYIVIVSVPVYIDKKFRLNRYTPVSIEKSLSKAVKSLTSSKFRFGDNYHRQPSIDISLFPGLFEANSSHPQSVRHLNGSYRPLLLPRKLLRRHTSENSSRLQQFYSYCPEWFLSCWNWVTRYPTVNKTLIFLAGKMTLLAMFMEIDPNDIFRRNNTIGCSRSQLHHIRLIINMCELVLFLMPDILTTYRFQSDPCLSLPDSKQADFLMENGNNGKKFTHLRYFNRFYSVDQKMFALSVEFLFEDIFKINDQDVRLLVRLPKTLIDDIYLIFSQIHVLHFTKKDKSCDWHKVPKDVRKLIYKFLFNAAISKVKQDEVIKLASTKETIGYTKKQLLFTLFRPKKDNDQESETSHHYLNILDRAEEEKIDASLI